MNVITVAVTGASGLVGQHLLGVLAADERVGRIVALDVRVPYRSARKSEFHLVDITHSEIKKLLDRANVLVHLASIVDPIPDEALMARVNVGGTRRVLDAAAAVGVAKVVRVSGAAVYGAWANNPVPITEAAPLRPNPGFSPAVQAAEVERLLAEWRDEHPGVVVTTLRTAPVLGPGAERLSSRLLLGRPALRVLGAAAPVQAVHTDDLVDALARVVLENHPGVFNVAADGWLDHHDARMRGQRSWMPPLPAELLERVLGTAWRRGLGQVPPGVVPYLVHPWVVANDALKAIGWSPRHSNEEAMASGLASAPPASHRGRVAALGGIAGAGIVYAAMRRRARPAR